MTVASALRAFGRFWWEFIVGDDWKIAAGVALVLCVGGAFTATAATGADWLAPVIGLLVLALFAAVMLLDVRG
ncbi:MAG TPA: hypothetical protein VF094_03125 [Gaiellaceae bacterium]